MKLGIIREGKFPPDERVPLTPEHCKTVMETWPEVEVVVQPSSVRDIKDDEYLAEGIKLQENLKDCDILMGVKEVPLDELIPNKKYFFFSHTYKEQPYNAKLLRAVLDKNIQLIDYELLKNKDGHRVIGFGRYAGIVGSYNGFYAWGKKFNVFDLKRAYLCHDREEAEYNLSKIVLPVNFKLVVTGKGRVGMGADEILDLIDIEEVGENDFLNRKIGKPSYCHIDVESYNKHPEMPFDRNHFFFDHEEEYESDFFKFAKVADMYFACHYWANNAPMILTSEQIARDDFNIKVIADISCDIKEPIASTLRATTIANPLFGYDRQLMKEVEFRKLDSLTVMAVDNLPCELARDASVDFGDNLIEHVFPHLFGNDRDGVIERASETNLHGELMPDYAYLESYALN